MDHQDLLSTAIGDLGTRPHRLRFFEQHAQYSFSKPRHAHLALAALAQQGVIAGMPSGQLTVEVGADAHRAKRLFRALSALHPDDAPAPGARMRALVIAGTGTARLLVFADTSALFAREEDGRMVFWPGTTRLYRQGPSLRAKEPRWGIKVTVGSVRTPGTLALSVPGPGDAQDTGGMHTTTLSLAHTWEHAPLDSDTHPDAAAMLASLREAIDTIDVRLFPPSYRLNPHARPLGGHWPVWLPHRAVPESQVEAVCTAALPALAWLASARPEITHLTLSMAHGPDMREGHHPVMLTIHSAGGGKTYQTIARILDRVEMPAAVRTPLRALNTVGWGRVLVRPTGQRLARFQPPKPTFPGPIAVNTSAHSRLALLHAYGPCASGL